MEPMRRTTATGFRYATPIRATIGLVGCLACGIGLAESRQLGTHEHGTAVLNVAVADATLSIEYQTPAANLVGFEHEARTDAQKMAVDDAEKVLKSGKILTLPEDAACELTAVEVEHEAEGEHHDEHEHHDEKKEHHTEGETDHDHRDHDMESHAEFHVLMTYECQNIEALTHIDVDLFRLFPGNEKIRTQAITPSGQTGGELTPDSARLMLP
jgi:hypothetical protein